MLLNSLRGLLLTIPLILLGCSSGGGNAGGPGTPSGDVVGSGGGSGGGSTGPVVVTVTLSSSVVSIGLSDTADLVAKVTDGNGDPIEGLSVTFAKISGPQGATVSASAITNAAGEATAVLNPGTNAGAVEITATAGGITSAPVTVTITLAVADSLTVSISPTEITLNGQAVMNVTVKDADGNPISGKVVQFDLTSAPTGTTIDASATTNDLGAASATIEPGTEVGTVTATASVDGLDASDTVEIIPASSGSIAFVSATPTLIGVRGSGIQETSVVVFEVRDQDGNLVPDGTVVTFQLVGPDGTDAALLKTTDKTAGGQAAVVVTSGNVANPIQVVASVTLGASEVSAISNNITVGTGVPSQEHISLAGSPLNIAGRNIVGLTAEIGFYGADRFGNSLPAGTAISFTTEGGAIDAQGLTDDTGDAVVTLESQAPFSDDGVTTQMARVVGEESFVDANADGVFNYTDTNGNGVHDQGEPSEEFFDIGEAFVDGNDNGKWDGDDPDTVADEGDTSRSQDDRTFAGTADGIDGDFNSSCAPVPISRGYFYDRDANGVYDPPVWTAEAGSRFDADPASGDEEGDVWIGVSLEGNGFTDPNHNCKYDGPPETFIDPTGDGRYMVGHDYTDLNANGIPDGGEAFIQEVYFDGKQNGFRDGAYDLPNGSWDPRIFVFRSHRTIFSGPTHVAASPARVFIGGGQDVTVDIYVGDDLGHCLADGSKVVISTGPGSVGQLANTGTWEFGGGFCQTIFPVTIINNLADTASPGFATVNVEVTAANGSGKFTPVNARLIPPGP